MYDLLYSGTFLKTTVISLCPVRKKADENPVQGPSSSKSGVSKKLAAKKKTRRVLTLEEKYQVVKALSKGKKQAEVFFIPLCHNRLLRQL